VLSKLLLLVLESGIRYRIFSRLSWLCSVSANKSSFKSGTNVPFCGRSNATFTERPTSALHNSCSIKSVFKLATKQSWISKLFRLLIPVATQSNSWFYAHSFAAISGSNPSEECKCCALSGRGLCDWPIPRPEASHQVCVSLHYVVILCD
jgi:hypothetical protein